jgi:hypothetical protein
VISATGEPDKESVKLQVRPTITSGNKKIELLNLDSAPIRILAMQWWSPGGHQLHARSDDTVLLEPSSAFAISVPDGLAQGLYYFRVISEDGASHWFKMVIQ